MLAEVYIFVPDRLKSSPASLLEAFDLTKLPVDLVQAYEQNIV